MPQSSKKYFRDEGELKRTIDKAINLWEEQVLSGICDSTNKVFTTTKRFNINTLTVFKNGLRLAQGVTLDYFILDDRTIQISVPPAPNSVILADFIPNE